MNVVCGLLFVVVVCCLVCVAGRLFVVLLICWFVCLFVHVVVVAVAAAVAVGVVAAVVAGLVAAVVIPADCCCCCFLLLLLLLYLFFSCSCACSCSCRCSLQRRVHARRQGTPGHAQRRRGGVGWDGQRTPMTCFPTRVWLFLALQAFRGSNMRFKPDVS